LSDGGLDWEWTRTEFRKTLLNCANSTNDVGISEGLELVSDLHACSLLMLNFRHRLSLKQQRGLSDLAAACEFPGCELRDGDPEWNEELTRGYLEDAMKRARRFRPLFEGI
jgi:hypothetical protein